MRTTLFFLATFLMLILQTGAATKPPRASTSAPGESMVFVPAGWFLMGSNEGNDNEYPQRRVYLDAYRIDKYPVSNNKYSGPKTQEYKPPFSKGRHPTVGISWFQAMKFCRSRGKRLPTEAEWEKAARGAKGNKYPWGNRWDPSRLVWAKNSGDQTHPVDRKTLNHTSPYGVVDMMGNVMEWVADWYQEDYYKKGPDKNPKGPKKRKNARYSRRVVVHGRPVGFGRRRPATSCSRFLGRRHRIQMREERTIE